MKKKLWIGLIIFIFLILCGVIYVYSQDNFRFKIEYEVYNYFAFDNGKKIVAKIPKKNTVKYLDEKDFEKAITEKTGIFYLGYPTCPWCRNITPILVETAKEEKMDIYYLNVHDVDTENIQKILEDYLEEDEDGNKHVYVPDVYFVKEGKILSHHLGAVESYKNAFLGMNEEQKSELKNIYLEGIKSILEG